MRYYTSSTRYFSVTRLMNVRQVAEYLNIKERKVYDLVKKGSIPCTRVTGKWLFPRERIDQWVAESMGESRADPAQGIAPPPVVAGSHDPLLEWSLRESGCGLALMPGGSLDGLARLEEGEALICGLHILDPASGAYNVPAIRNAKQRQGMVLIEWSKRVQGLVFALDNPCGIASLHDLAAKNPRTVQREEGAGTRLLLSHLLSQSGIDPREVNLLDRIARTQTEVGLAILEGWADTGLAVEAVAHQLKLDFLPLHSERYDLALRRRDYFQPSFQKLLSFTRSSPFQNRAKELGGYDISGLGTVHYNGE